MNVILWLLKFILIVVMVLVVAAFLGIAAFFIYIDFHFMGALFVMLFVIGFNCIEGVFLNRARKKRNARMDELWRLKTNKGID